MKPFAGMALLLLLAGCVSTQNDFSKGVSDWESLMESYGLSENYLYPSKLSEKKLLLSDLQSLKSSYESKNSREAIQAVSWMSAYERGLTVQLLMQQSQEHLIASNQTVDCSPGSEYSKALENWQQARENARELVSETEPFSGNEALSPHIQRMTEWNESQLPLLQETEERLEQLCA